MRTWLCALTRLRRSSIRYFSSLTTNPKRIAEQSCLALLEACDSLPKLVQVQAHLFKLGLHSNNFVLTKFSQISSSLRSIEIAADLIFCQPASTIKSFDAFLCNTVIRAFANSANETDKAASIFALMRWHNISPNKFTFPFLLKASASLDDYNLIKKIHGNVVKFGFSDDLYVQNTLVHGYSSVAQGLESACQVFDGMPKSDSVSWSAMIGGYVRNSRSSEAIGMFRKMQMASVKPDEVTMVTVLSACADLGALEIGRWIARYVERDDDIVKTVPLCNALIDMFAKCGGIDDALRLFQDMPEKSIVTWTSMIDGLAMHGRGVEAISLFEEMKKKSMVPDDVAFIGVLTACSHVGMVDQGRQYFDSMSSEFGIVPKIEHYGCMVDLFSRAGLVEHALEFINKMPIETNPIIWRTMISACRMHGKLELGESITKRLIRNEPTHESNYVLLSNVYASMSQWEKKSIIRRVMGVRGMRKVPGCTSVELNNEIYEFIAGDKSHPQYKEIYEMVDEMGKELKRAGYIPTTSEVLFDIDDEDKEDALNRHSEKLAIAFALLNTKPETPIRIVKNLRVCGDCHSATKFISMVYGREITVRDRNRFHLFKAGECSCKDFW
ncbi:pentatricopeptide repeat-containing protein At4g21065-like [Aristolochia californica]|uniref:pentatricopeptide repeat-containing protein At4g21065-like n=1 Tax=Aristolochia californica TaxID=171875 RepID=UPI0035E00079